MAMNSIDSSKGRLRSTYVAIMIPLGVAINFVGGQIATSLGLPIYLDSIGTIIVSAIMAPGSEQLRVFFSTLSLLLFVAILWLRCLLCATWVLA